MEGDNQVKTYLYFDSHFNPLPPHGGRLSILPGDWITRNHFNPLPPHGGRRLTQQQQNYVFAFQSTPSAWRETVQTGYQGGLHRISIHSLRMEGDKAIPQIIVELWNFNPLPPHGGRQFIIVFHSSTIHFNPLPPHGGRRTLTIMTSSDDSFQSTPSAWRETL